MPLKKERSHRIKISEISYAIKERKNEVTELKFTKFHMPLKKERMKSRLRIKIHNGFHIPLKNKRRHRIENPRNFICH